MATFELPDLPQARVSPTLLLGAVSPLWGYFGAVAAGGVAYWWMTRLARPVNLEALLSADIARPVEVLMTPVVETAEAAVEAVQVLAEAAADAMVPEVPVGGEAAPVSPLAAQVEPAPETPLPVLSSAPVLSMAPVLSIAPEPAPVVEPAIADPETAPEAAKPRARVKKAAPDDEG